MFIVQLNFLLQILSKNYLSWPNILLHTLETTSFLETRKEISVLSNEQNHNNRESVIAADVEDGSVIAQKVNVEKQSLPEGIKIIETILMGVSHYGVFCSDKLIKKGTRFGPFTGRNILPDDISTLGDTSYTWEVSIYDS